MYSSVFKLVFIACLLLTFQTARATVAGPQTFTFSGQLTDLSDQSLIDPSVVIDLKIYNSAGTCVLYEESQTVNTSASDGRFTLVVGSATGSTKRVSGEPGNAMTMIFQNTSPIMGSCGTYTPAAGDTRLLRVTIAPSTTGTVQVLSPDSIIGSVPNALVAESLQGLDREHVLAIDSSTNLNQTNLSNIFSATNYPLLATLLAGASSSYVANSPVKGAQIPSFTTYPSNPIAGSLWFNSNAQALQYYNGGAINTLSSNQWTTSGSNVYYGSGNVGIGTAAPAYNLQVIGNAGLSTGTAWTNASDRRLKDVQGDYEYGLDEVLQLHTVRYHYKKGNALGLPADPSMTGIIAQEVQSVIPDAIHTRKDGYLELNIDPIHWAVVNSIKEFYNRWTTDRDAKSAQIASLKKQVQDLKALACLDHPDAGICREN